VNTEHLNNLNSRFAFHLGVGGCVCVCVCACSHMCLCKYLTRGCLQYHFLSQVTWFAVREHGTVDSDSTFQWPKNDII
jgi:hypothetical protein